MGTFKVLAEYVDDQNIAIQRFENSLGHCVRAYDKDAEGTYMCTLFPSAEMADKYYKSEVEHAKDI